MGTGHFIRDFSTLVLESSVVVSLAQLNKLLTVPRYSPLLNFFDLKRLSIGAVASLEACISHYKTAPAAEACGAVIFGAGRSCASEAILAHASLAAPNYKRVPYLLSCASPGTLAAAGLSVGPMVAIKSCQHTRRPHTRGTTHRGAS